MTWLHDWWHDEIVHGYKGPLMLSFVAFVITFVIVRVITRMIRAGKGPFGNISSGGVHLHHSIPGLLILIAGAFVGIGSPPMSVWTYLAAVAIGLGTALVLDEFAMLFRLQDVYWTQEGQLSVNIATLAAAIIGLAAVGLSPAQMTQLSGVAIAWRGIAVALLLVHLVLVVVTGLKGKYSTAIVGLFVSPIAWFGAIRLARPTSPWARWFYSEHRKARAKHRADTFDKRWDSVRVRWDDVIAGTPSMPNPPTPGAK
ncbi:hypothetical protein [Jongsikchunia kroppenstedtii]|uniref:hypothetical protein n=1 Tax=Jongsikchunia kroppenstedtii TaxID=1121721 RepID=UPI000360645C|nr:hypothetical protein [Jongsikchunia kroppenstedtii]